jgi:hypothetical protein
VRIGTVLTDMTYTGYNHSVVTAKWRIDAGVMWTIYELSLSQFHMVNSTLANGMIGGGISFSDGMGFFGIPVINTNSGAISYSNNAPADAARQPNTFGAISYNSSSNSMVYRDTTGQYYVAYLQRSFGIEIPVAAIITDLCLRVGLTADMINTSLVTATTVGYVVHDNRSCGAALADLCHVYQIDMVESDYTLKFTPRGRPVVATLTQADLASVDQNDNSHFWVATHAPEQEMPLQVTLKYSDPHLDYQPGSAYARRTALPVPTTFAKRKLTIDLPVVARPEHGSSTATSINSFVAAAQRSGDRKTTTLPPFCDGHSNAFVFGRNLLVGVVRQQRRRDQADDRAYQDINRDRQT